MSKPDISQEALDRVLSLMPRIACNSLIHQNAIKELKDYFSTFDVSTLNSKFAQAYINETFPALVAFIHEDPITDVFFLYEILVMMSIKFSNSVTSAAKTILLDSVRSIPEVKRCFITNVHNFVGMYGRTDQISLFKSIGYFDFELLEPILHPKTVSEFNEIKDMIVQMLPDNQENVIQLLFDYLKNPVLKITVGNFIEKEVASNEKLKSMLATIEPTSPTDLKLLIKSENYNAEKVNDFLNDQFITEYYGGLKDFTVKKCELLFAMLYARFVIKMEDLKEGVADAVGAFLLQIVTTGIIKETNCEEVTELEESIFVVIKKQATFPVEEYRECIIQNALLLIKKYIEMNVDSCFEAINELWDIITICKEQNYIENIIRVFDTLICGQDQTLSEFLVVVLTERLDVINVKYFDSVVGADLLIHLIEKIYSLEKEKKGYKLFTGIKTMEWFFRVEKLCEMMTHTAAKRNIQTFTENVYCAADVIESTDTLFLKLFEEKNEKRILLLQKVLYCEGGSKHKSCHIRKVKYQIRTLENQIENVTVTPETLVSEILERMRCISSGVILTSSIQETPGYQNIQIGQMKTPVTEELCVEQFFVEEEKGVKDETKTLLPQFKFLCQVKEDDIKAVVDKCLVSREKALSTLQSFGDVESASKYLLGNTKNELQAALGTNHDLLMTYKNIDELIKGKKSKTTDLLNSKSFNENVNKLFSFIDSSDDKLAKSCLELLDNIPKVKFILNKIELIQSGVETVTKGSELVFILEELLSTQNLTANTINWVYNVFEETQSSHVADLSLRIFLKYKKAEMVVFQQQNELISKSLNLLQSNNTQLESFDLVLSLAEFCEDGQYIVDGSVFDRIYTILNTIFELSKDENNVVLLLSNVIRIFVNNLFVSKNFSNISNHMEELLEELTKEENEIIGSEKYILLIEIIKSILSIPESHPFQEKVKDHVKSLLTTVREEKNKKSYGVPYCLKLLELFYKTNVIDQKDVINLCKVMAMKCCKQVDFISYPSRHALACFMNMIKKDENVWKEILPVFEDQMSQDITPVDYVPKSPLQEKGIVGLHNLGSTCYINVVIQLLYNMTTFREEILAYSCDSLDKVRTTSFNKEKKDQKKNKVSNNNAATYNNKCKEKTSELENVDPAVTVLRQLQTLFLQMKSGQSASLSPIMLIESIQNYKHRDDLKKTQHDAGDFLMLLLDCIEEAVNTKAVFDDFKCVMDESIKRTDEAQTLISSRITDTRMLFLPVEKSLQCSLAAYFKDETFTGENKIRLESGELVEATKHVSFKNTPNYLLFQINRFFISTDLTAQKNDSECSIPETITLDHCNDTKTYHLHTIVTHFGSVNAGHYICFTNTPSGWIECNDYNVLPITQDNVMERSVGGPGKSSAYILVYSATAINKDIKISITKEIDEERERLAKSVCGNDIDLFKIVFGGKLSQFVIRFVLDRIRLGRENLLYLVDPLIIKIKESQTYTNDFSDVTKDLDAKFFVSTRSKNIRRRFSEIVNYLVNYSSENSILTFSENLLEQILVTRADGSCVDDYFLLLTSLCNHENVRTVLVQTKGLFEKLAFYLQGKDDKTIYQTISGDYTFSSLIRLLLTIVEAERGLKYATKTTIITSLSLDFTGKTSNIKTSDITRLLKHLCRNNLENSTFVVSKLRGGINLIKQKNEPKVDKEHLLVLLDMACS
ncbi:hypothetical protein EIN_222010 [Entamoeba invadens IP1]|uniref:USP domain-containing protein n=1 Tax=Entamoeba invadens IP1 TaxID=370355 RepID=A0A0A1U7Y1_ENTIV|nr:hypothetical protein EIN_222010 [Entamoeba invadens IP1]ELP88068.1 hypothetical protein EIN_222010 [Entamoeba invadens IP1]|eukprot:XP_004254839.1 hypothetical protein EIN_222010 [Entamoeba invadens IP1]